MMNEKKHGIGHNIRQAVLVTVVLLVLCGLVFPVLLSGLSAVIFPSQAKGSLVTADGIAVGAKNVGQDFTEDYFMWCRPSAYNYNTYYEEDTDGDGQVEQYYNDGSEFAGLSSGSNNYAPLQPRPDGAGGADIEEFLEKNPGVSREDIPTDLMTASGSGWIPTPLPASCGGAIPRLWRPPASVRMRCARSSPTTPRQDPGRVRRGDRQRAGRESGHRPGHGPGG